MVSKDDDYCEPVGDVVVHKYEVLVLRKSYMTEYIKVEATSEKEAEQLALKEAEKIEFLGDEYFDEYAVDEVVRIDD